MRLPEFITSRCTQFGFAIVLMLCAALVWVLLVQVDTWSKAGFDLVKNNTQQVQLVLTMRDSVQKREMIIQRMMSMAEVFDLDAEAIDFYQLAAVYTSARENLLYKTQLDHVLMESLQQLDEAVSYAQPYHNNLVEVLVFGNLHSVEMLAIYREGRKATTKVLFLLDKIVEHQSSAYETVITEYERSRRYTLFAVFCVFALALVVIVYAIRTSSNQLKQVSRLTIIDEVSGIYNRRYFDMVLDEEWKRSMREYTQLSLLMLDIDFFKAYNDSFGHQMGDTCLYSVGKILSSQLKRASDFTARYGGEEFVIVLPNTNREHARLLAERLRRSVEEARIKSGSQEVSPWVTLSIGVATTTAEFGQDYSVLVNAADECLYESKRSGRNKVCDRSVDDLD